MGELCLIGPLYDLGGRLVHRGFSRHCRTEISGALALYQTPERTNPDTGLSRLRDSGTLVSNDPALTCYLEVSPSPSCSIFPVFVNRPERRT